MNVVNAVALYFHYVLVAFRTQLQYRASFVLQTLGQLLVTGVEFLGIWALFARFGGIAGWRLAEVAFFYGLADMTFAISDALARGFDRVGTLVKNGELDRILLRPRSTVLQLLGQEITIKRLGRFAQAVVVLTWASVAADVSWSAPKLALLVATLAGGVCLFIGLSVLQATSTFWTIETLEVWSAFTHGGNYASQYPITIYRPWFRRFFTFVLPLACVNYLPALALLGRSDPLGAPDWARWLAPLAGVGFLLLALQAWKLGLRRYASTGS